VGILDLFRGSPDERVAKRFIEELRKVGEKRRLEYDAGERLIVCYDEEGNRSGTLSLHNLQHELDRSAKQEHDEIFRRYALGSINGGHSKNYAEVQPSLGILLKDASYPEFIALLQRVEVSALKPNSLIWRPLAADVIACCVVDGPNSISFVKQSDLEDWGVDADQVFEQAVANLRALPMEFHALENCYYVLAQDSFIAARLLCAERFAEVPLKGLPVAVVPDRDTLFIAGSEDDEAIKALSNLVNRQLVEANRHISTKPLVLKDGRWQEFQPRDGARAAFDNASRTFAVNTWAAFHALYEKDLQAREEDVFVAQLAVFEVEGTGECFTSAVWSRDVDTILPLAERVHFFDTEDETIRAASWPDVVRVMGAAMQQLEGLPFRYRVNQFPTSEQFVAMGARQV
jgi:uncharacterized protein YtpQ (UPF0354 family)